MVKEIPVLVTKVTETSIDNLRQMTDMFREKYSSGIVAIGTVYQEKPSIICAITDDLIQKFGLNAGEIVRASAAAIEGSGGGRPNLAQAGGKDPAKIDVALEIIRKKIEEKL